MIVFEINKIHDNNSTKNGRENYLNSYKVLAFRGGSDKTTNKVDLLLVKHTLIFKAGVCESWPVGQIFQQLVFLK